MYGMVNQGIQAYVTENLGDAVWNAIAGKAGIVDEEFETMLAYDDDVTYRLVAAASQVLGISATEVLDRFGAYWIGFASDTAVGRLLSFGGETFYEHLHNLNDMHDRIKLSLPHLNPPTFRLEQADGAVHRLHYFSDRVGLQPMVFGLLQGLAQASGVKIEVRMIESRMDGADHDVFEIREIGSVPAVA